MKIPRSSIGVLGVTILGITLIIAPSWGPFALWCICLPLQLMGLVIDRKVDDKEETP